VETNAKYAYVVAWEDDEENIWYLNNLGVETSDVQQAIQIHTIGQAELFRRFLNYGDVVLQIARVVTTVDWIHDDIVSKETSDV